MRVGGSGSTRSWKAQSSEILGLGILRVGSRVSGFRVLGFRGDFRYGDLGVEGRGAWVLSRCRAFTV